LTARKEVAGAVVLESPEWLVIQPPPAFAMLGSLDPKCGAVDVRTRLPDDDFARLAEAMRSRPDVMLFISEDYDDTIGDLEFLRYFPWLDRLSVSALSLQSLAGLRHLTHVRDLHLNGARRPPASRSP